MTPQRLRGGKQDEVTLGDRAPRRRPPCAELGCQGALTRQGSGDMERGHRGGPSASPVPLEGGRTKTPRERAPDASSAWPGKEAFYFSSVLFCNCHGSRVGWGGVGWGLSSLGLPGVPVSVASICSWAEHRGQSAAFWEGLTVKSRPAMLTWLCDPRQAAAPL